MTTCYAPLSSSSSDHVREGSRVAGLGLSAFEISTDGEYGYGHVSSRLDMDMDMDRDRDSQSERDGGRVAVLPSPPRSPYDTSERESESESASFRHLRIVALDWTVGLSFCCTVASLTVLSVVLLLMVQASRGFPAPPAIIINDQDQQQDECGSVSAHTAPTPINDTLSSALQAIWAFSIPFGVLAAVIRQHLRTKRATAGHTQHPSCGCQVISCYSFPKIGCCSCCCQSCNHQDVCPPWFTPTPTPTQAHRHMPVSSAPASASGASSSWLVPFQSHARYRCLSVNVDDGEPTLSALYTSHVDYNYSVICVRWSAGLRIFSTHHIQHLPPIDVHAHADADTDADPTAVMMISSASFGSDMPSHVMVPPAMLEAGHSHLSLSSSTLSNSHHHHTHPSTSHTGPSVAAVHQPNINTNSNTSAMMVAAASQFEDSRRSLLVDSSSSSSSLSSSSGLCASTYSACISRRGFALCMFACLTVSSVAGVFSYGMTVWTSGASPFSYFFLGTLVDRLQLPNLKEFPAELVALVGWVYEYCIGWLWDVAPPGNADWGNGLSFHGSSWLLLALLEEIGWCGVVYPSVWQWVSSKRWSWLYDSAGKTNLVANVIVGLIWASWHWLFILGGYTNLIPYTAHYYPGNTHTPFLYAFVMFTLQCITLRIFISHMVMLTSTIWAAVLIHAVHNALVYSFFAQLICVQASNHLASYMVGESSIWLILAYATTATICYLIPSSR